MSISHSTHGMVGFYLRMSVAMQILPTAGDYKICFWLNPIIPNKIPTDTKIWEPTTNTVGSG